MLNKCHGDALGTHTHWTRKFLGEADAGMETYKTKKDISLPSFLSPALFLLGGAHPQGSVLWPSPMQHLLMIAFGY